MRLVLDNVDQGFVTLSLDGKMSSERSAIFDRWFREYSNAQTFWQERNVGRPTAGGGVSEISGRGVGMSVVRQRVESLRGKLEVQSQRGVGTTWRVTLPWAPEPVAERLRRFSQRNAELKRASAPPAARS